MRRLSEPMRRNALPLLLTGAMVYVLLAWMLPALRELEDLRRQQARVDATMRQRAADVSAMEDWLWGVEQDPVTQQRLAELRRFAADVEGPRVVLEEATPDP